MYWKDLAKENNQIKLYPSTLSLADLFNFCKKENSNLVKYITKEQLDHMIKPAEPYTLPAFIMINVYLTKKDKNNKRKTILMAFSNHGQVHFCQNDILSEYKFNSPSFFFNFKIKDLKNPPIQHEYAESYCFSTDKDSIRNWDANYNFEAIFDYYDFNGFDEMAAFAGFYIIKDK